MSNFISNYNVKKFDQTMSQEFIIGNNFFMCLTIDIANKQISKAETTHCYGIYGNNKNIFQQELINSINFLDN